jgi:hypothetical protein
VHLLSALRFAYKFIFLIGLRLRMTKFKVFSWLEYFLHDQLQCTSFKNNHVEMNYWENIISTSL